MVRYHLATTVLIAAYLMRLPVLGHSSNPKILMIQTAQPQYRCDTADGSSAPEARTVLVQCQVSSNRVTIQPVGARAA
jgi:hypothetical protein